MKNQIDLTKWRVGKAVGYRYQYDRGSRKKTESVGRLKLVMSYDLRRLTWLVVSGCAIGQQSLDTERKAYDEIYSQKPGMFNAQPNGFMMP